MYFSLYYQICNLIFFFKVLYVGRIYIPNRRLNEGLVDAALVKFRRNDLHKHLTNNGYHNLKRLSQVSMKESYQLHV